MSMLKSNYSMILAFAGIPQRGPLSPNGRVFRKLAAEVPNFFINDDDSIFEMTYEEAFLIRFTRWLPASLRCDFWALFDKDQFPGERKKKAKEFLLRLREHEQNCPPPWKELQA